MSAMKIKKGDTVKVIAGKDKGQVTRVGFKVEDGKKVRIAKKTGDVID